jgi:hypothetical protein
MLAMDIDQNGLRAVSRKYAKPTLNSYVVSFIFLLAAGSINLIGVQKL